MKSRQKRFRCEQLAFVVPNGSSLAFFLAANSVPASGTGSETYYSVTTLARMDAGTLVFVSVHACMCVVMYVRTHVCM